MKKLYLVGLDTIEVSFKIIFIYIQYCDKSNEFKKNYPLHLE